MNMVNDVMAEAAKPIFENKIHKVIVHTVVKKDGKFELDPRDKTLEVGKTVQRLIDQLAHLYATKAGKEHGRFEADEENYPVSKFLREYYNSPARDLLDASLNMSGTLIREAQRTASPGGHVFFAHFTRITPSDNDDYFIVAILNDELGTALKDKEVVDATHLDIKGFRLAGRINLTKWQAKSETYLSFLKGKGQDKISGFFKAFLGCNNSVAAAAETKNLTQVLEQFAESKEMPDEVKSEFLRKAYTICKGYADTDRPFELEPFSNELWPEAPEELISAISDSDANISDGFVPDKRSLNRLVKFSGKSKHWRLDFDRLALESKEIQFDKDNGTLTITQLPAELLERMMKEHRDDEEDEA
ncbi:nucleoid-associated protein [Pseudomonas sp. NPDC086251]|uniref:nucleoid-associated protein n=1 Tax=Pseudomonas sp. NPDC086251 TaxID=3364431 RepID=UPI003832995C